MYLHIFAANEEQKQKLGIPRSRLSTLNIAVNWKHIGCTKNVRLRRAKAKAKATAMLGLSTRDENLFLDQPFLPQLIPIPFPEKESTPSTAEGERSA